MNRENFIRGSKFVEITWFWRNFAMGSSL